MDELHEPTEGGDFNEDPTVEQVDLSINRLKELLLSAEEEVRKVIRKQRVNRKTHVFYRPRAITAEYEKELIQVAASALHALADHYASTDGYPASVAYEKAITESRVEIERQGEKFGYVPCHRDPMIWMAVVAEELSEAMQECLDVYE